MTMFFFKVKNIFSICFKVIADFNVWVIYVSVSIDYFFLLIMDHMFPDLVSFACIVAIYTGYYRMVIYRDSGFYNPSPKSIYIQEDKLLVNHFEPVEICFYTFSSLVYLGFAFILRTTP